MLLALLLACRCNPLDAPQDLTFPSPVVRQVGGRFRGEPETPLDPQVAFAVQPRCPRIDSVHVRPANERIREVTIRGDQLRNVERVGAALADGTLANAQFLFDDGALVFPVACTDCEVYLGVKAGDRTAACIGPGYSLTFHEGRVLP